MATAAEDYLAIAANIRTELRNETGRRAALTALGHPPPATYTVAGKSVAWTEYMKEMMAVAKGYEELAAAADPFEIHQIGY